MEDLGSQVVADALATITDEPDSAAQHPKRKKAKKPVSLRLCIKLLWNRIVRNHRLYAESVAAAQKRQDEAASKKDGEAAASKSDSATGRTAIRFKISDEASEIFEQLVRKLVALVAASVRDSMGHRTGRKIHPRIVNLAILNTLRNTRLVKSILEDTKHVLSVWSQHRKTTAQEKIDQADKSDKTDTQVAKRKPVRPNSVTKLALSLPRMHNLFIQSCQAYPLNLECTIIMTSAIENILSRAMTESATILFNSRVRKLSPGHIQQSIGEDMQISVVWRGTIFLSRATDVTVANEVLARVKENMLRSRKRKSSSSRRRKRSREANESASRADKPNRVRHPKVHEEEDDDVDDDDDDENVEVSDAHNLDELEMDSVDDGVFELDAAAEDDLDDAETEVAVLDEESNASDDDVVAPPPAKRAKKASAPAVAKRPLAPIVPIKKPAVAKRPSAPIVPTKKPVVSSPTGKQAPRKKA